MALKIVIWVFIAIGLFFQLLAVIGLHRFPDVYTRLHAATKCTTFGSIFLILAVVIEAVSIWVVEGSSSPQSILTFHGLIALAAILATNPPSAHATARCAHRSGVKPARAVVDDLEKEKSHAVVNEPEKEK